MKLTRNTKLYKSSDGTNVEITFRTLNVTELSVIESINSQYHKKDTAYNLGYISGDEPNFFVKQQIGQDIIEASTLELQDETLLELTIDDFRNSVKNDFIFGLIQSIVAVIPSTSIEYLLSLTLKDLIELTVLCENLTNKKIFSGPSTSSNSVQIKDDHAFFEDDGKSLQEKMKDLGNF